MIYVTVGTMHLDFPRLIRAADRYAEQTDEEIIIQIGMGSTIPTHATLFDFKPREEILEIQREARIIVTHAGIGSVIDALQMQKPLIVVPRLKKFGEHNTDHQLELARAIHKRGWGVSMKDIDDLIGRLDNPPPAYKNYTPAKDQLIDSVRLGIASFIQ
jgi:UDP-N-acetylglucosamine transferase subunit ALG13